MVMPARSSHRSSKCDTSNSRVDNETLARTLLASALVGLSITEASGEDEKDPRNPFVHPVRLIQPIPVGDVPEFGCCRNRRGIDMSRLDSQVVDCGGVCPSR